MPFPKLKDLLFIVGFLIMKAPDICSHCQELILYKIRGYAG